MQRQRFIITDRAGSWIAGQRNPGAGMVLELTPQQAAHELRLGTIVHDQPSGARGRKRKSELTNDVHAIEEPIKSDPRMQD